MFDQEVLGKLETIVEIGKVRKHETYINTGILCADIKKLYGTAGIDVNYAHIYPTGKVEILTKDNIHYGYGFINDDLHIVDKSNRAVFEII